MQAHYWGLKTFYYSLINKAGSKISVDAIAESYVNGHALNGRNGISTELDLFEEDCEACKL